MRWFGGKRKFSSRTDYSSLIDLERNALGDIDQCLRDWGRNVDRIFIAGESEAKSLRDICHEEGIEEPLQMNGEQLKGIWRKYFLNGVFAEKNIAAMMEHFEQTMHQGGYLYMLQSACFEVGLKNGVLFSSDQVDHQVTFFVDNDKVGIVESLQVKQYNSLSEPKILTGNSKDPLMTALGEYAIAFDGENPRCDVIKVILDPKDDFTRTLFEESVPQTGTNRPAVP